MLLSSELLLCFLDLQILNQDVVTIFYVGLQYLVLHSLYIPFSWFIYFNILFCVMYSHSHSADYTHKYLLLVWLDLLWIITHWARPSSVRELWTGQVHNSEICLIGKGCYSVKIVVSLTVQGNFFHMQNLAQFSLKYQASNIGLKMYDSAYFSSSNKCTTFEVFLVYSFFFWYFIHIMHFNVAPH